MKGYGNRTCTYAAYKRPTQIESKVLEENIPSKWAGEKSWCSNTYIRQERLQNKGHKKRHRRTLHNTQGKNTSRDINIINTYAPNRGACKHIRKISGDFKNDIDSNTLTLGDF